MASGAETTQKLRRPTAFEVSFPNEFSEDDDDGEDAGEDNEDTADEMDDVRISRRGKRKYDSIAGYDGRVRFAIISPPFDATHFGREV